MTRTKTLRDRLHGLAFVLAAAAVLAGMSFVQDSLTQRSAFLGAMTFGLLLFAAAVVTTQPVE